MGDTMCKECVTEANDKLGKEPKGWNRSGFKMSKEERDLLPGKEYPAPVSSLTPEQQDEHRLWKRHYDRAYRAWNREKNTGLTEYQSEYHRIHRIRHPEKARGRDKANYVKNPEIMKKHERKRRAQKAAVESHPYSLQDIIDVWGILCYICNEDVDMSAPRTSKSGIGWERGLHLDHVIPIAVGGPDTIDNVRPTHAICNLRRPKRLTLDFFDAFSKEQISRIKKFKGALKQAKPGRPLKD